MKLKIDYSKNAGTVKLMNAVNNGPVHTENSDQNSGNLETYRSANIPFARTHDASFCSRYGGEHTVDVHLIFRDFAADPYDCASYDFTLTDEYLNNIKRAGTEIFYRLGSKIEHESKKYGTVVPPDFQKWAVICEHIIAHVNEGWADGFHMGVKYWEIWNEPDLYGKCWGGTPQQYYQLYAVASSHLKKCFPDIKIGGPAVTGYNENWLRPFFEKIRDEKLPFDFYSWHCYSDNVKGVVENVRLQRALLNEYGFNNVESILNEWNYVCGWSGESWIRSIETEISMKGAAFIAAVMAACQREPVDMLMYYDARPCAMNGLFSVYTYKTLKGYHSIKTWGEMLSMGKACPVECDIPDIYAAAAKNDAGDNLALVAYYSNNDDSPVKTFTAELLGASSERHTVYLLDGEHDMTECGTLYADGNKITVTMKVNTVIAIK